jgi:methionyl-tRNA formyltransferase
MKAKIKTVFIGNRPAILESVYKNTEIDLVHVFAIKESMIKVDSIRGDFSFVSSSGDKNKILDFLFNADYQLCISAGCPYVLPIGKCPADKVYINSHPSVLPLGRGKHPINECILSGNNIAGATLHYLTDGLDEGDIISQEKFELTDELDLDVLYSFIFKLECEVFQDGLQKLIQSDLKFKGKPQTGTVTYFSRQNSDLFFDLSTGSADELIRKVRAFSSDNFGVKVSLNGTELTLHRVSRIKNSYLEERYRTTKTCSIALIGNNVLIVKLKDGLVRFDRWRSNTLSVDHPDLLQEFVVNPEIRHLGQSN